MIDVQPCSISVAFSASAFIERAEIDRRELRIEHSVPRPAIRLHMEAYLGAPESYDSVLIEGFPRIYSKVSGGIHGDVATASITVNSIPKVIAAAPGLRTMRDMPIPSYYGGR